MTVDISNFERHVRFGLLGCPEHVRLVPGLQEADELIIGLPVSADGRETPQSNKVRSVVGRLAVQAAERFVACVRFQISPSNFAVF